MKILFVCASLEPGRDGVGDYCRRFLTEMRKLGHDCAALSIHDRHVGPAGDDLCRSMKRCLSQKCEIRFSHTRAWGSRLLAANKLVNELRPDWTSFQYVPHGFHPKGLPWRLPKRLASLRNTGRRHLMFHELWIRPRKIVAPKDAIVCVLQQWIARNLAYGLNPKIIHTSNAVYQARLQKTGIRSRVLPLLSNIAIQNSPHHSRESLLEQVLPGFKGQSVWIFATFGSLRRAGMSSDLMAKLETARALASKSQCIVLSLGRTGEEGDSIWREFTTGGNPHFVFRRFGELPPKDVSSILQSADFGIASTPSHLLGKSGAVGAMRSHGLPVICNGIADFPADLLMSGKSDAFLNSNESAFPAKLASTMRRPPLDPAGLIAKQFLADLQFPLSQHE